MIIVWILWSNLVFWIALLGWLFRPAYPILTKLMWYVAEPALVISMVILCWCCVKEE